MILKILFCLKRREDFNAKIHNKDGLTTGLFNSAGFVNKMLQDAGINSNMVVVIDNNDIDREVASYKPDWVIIEALWVVPSKFAVLTKLHPKVKWIVRLHSEIPFMANEGIAMDWILDYLDFPKVYLGINAPRMKRDIEIILAARNGWTGLDFAQRIFYMPNYYPVNDFKPAVLRDGEQIIHVGCFGAIRPLKNHLAQAIAAIKFSDTIGKCLYLHVNADRLEMAGGPVLHNLKGLFQQLDPRSYQLITHSWQVHEDFLQVCASMDIGMQVSFSETFNIVGADLVRQGIPFVGSSEIPWIAGISIANPTDTIDIYKKLCNNYEKYDISVTTNQYGLQEYINNVKDIWLKLFKGT